MLINKLEYYKTRSNYTGNICGMDDPARSKNGKLAWNLYPEQDFDYKFNSWGFRGPEYDQFINTPVNICLGDSFTVNVGGPISHSWASQLAEHFDIPTLNLGMDGAGNDAIQLLYQRACEVFDVQDTFVMYSFLSRRLRNGVFLQEVHEDKDNFEYFLRHFISGVHSCAVPEYCMSAEEKMFFDKLGIYYLPRITNYSSSQHLDRTKCVIESIYNDARGSSWPTYSSFIADADPHPDMFTEEFGYFMENNNITNRDGFHLNYDSNKKYADYFIQDSQSATVML